MRNAPLAQRMRKKGECKVKREPRYDPMDETLKANYLGIQQNEYGLFLGRSKEHSKTVPVMKSCGVTETL